jgi:hypothetical protein
MSRPDDYGIVAEALRRLIDGRFVPVPHEALAALERLAEGEHTHANEYGSGATYDCASLRRDCLAKVRG